jgi:cholesterol transport system auxiliary component
MRCLILTLCLLCLTACSLRPVQTPPTSTYTLTAQNNIPAFSQQKKQQILLITAPTAAPGYQSANMIYTQRPFELRSFVQNRWAAPPAEMLAPLLIQNLQSSGCFSAAVAPPFLGKANLILDTKLLLLQQEFSGDKSQVRLALQFILTNYITGQVVKSQRIEVKVPATENNPYAGVIAANKAASNALEKISKMICEKTSQ